MAKSDSSRRWLQRQQKDIYVKRAQQEGYRSRAAYKLLELNAKDKFLRPGMTVVDLGAAPGGWSQVAASTVGERGHVVALDILPMDALAGVTFLQGDFHEETVLAQLLDTLAGRPVDLVLSDMSPNISGMRVVDQPRGMYLVELAWDFAQRALKAQGSFVVKLFQGEGSDAFYLSLKPQFASVVLRKPPASRGESREMYVVAKGYKAR